MFQLSRALFVHFTIPKTKPCQIEFSRRWFVTSQLYRPMAFYSLKPLTEQRVVQLKKTFEKNLSALGVVGRIYLAPAKGIGGINCQMSVPISQLDQVKEYFKQHESDFGTIEYTQGMEDTTAPSFEKLRVLVKKNLVAVRHNINMKELENQPEYLTAEEWHRDLKEKKDVFLIDMRNRYEYNLGHFTNAIKMDVDTFRDGVHLLDDMVKDRSKDEDIYMYCTGGIRCSVVGPYLKNKGYKHVKMLKGGISAYGQYIKENNTESLFKGKNFVFDGRRTERITDDVLSKCYQCGSSCDHITNCQNTRCHLLFIQCDKCSTNKGTTCSTHCQNVIEGKEIYKYDYDYHQQLKGIL